MVRIICWFSPLIFSLTCCNNCQQLLEDPIKVDKVSCECLLKQGYAWMPGTDVILFGKRKGDSLIYYHMDILDTQNHRLTESITLDEWESNKGERFINVDVEICKGLKPTTRYFDIELSQEQALNYIENPDSNFFQIKEDKFEVLQDGKAI